MSAFGGKADMIFCGASPRMRGPFLELTGIHQGFYAGAVNHRKFEKWDLNFRAPTCDSPDNAGNTG